MAGWLAGNEVKIMLAQLKLSLAIIRYSKSLFNLLRKCTFEFVKVIKLNLL